MFRVIGGRYGVGKALARSSFKLRHARWLSKHLREHEENVYHSSLHDTKLFADDNRNRQIFAAKTALCCVVSGLSPTFLSNEMLSGFMNVPPEAVHSVGFGCAFGALLTSIIISETTVAGVILKGSTRFLATITSGFAAYIAAAGISALGGPAVLSLTAASVFGVTGLSLYHSRNPAYLEYSQTFVTFGASFSFLLVDLTFHGLDLLILQERFLGILFGVAVSVPIHLYLFPRFSGTHLLYLTQTNLKDINEFIWRVTRAYLQNVGYATYFTADFDKDVVHGCFARVLLSRTKVDNELRAAKWESNFGGLNNDDVDRLARVNLVCRRVAAIGVSLDMLLTQRQLNKWKHSTAEFEQLVAFEQAVGNFLHTLQPMLTGPITMADKELLHANAKHLDMVSKNLSTSMTEAALTMASKHPDPSGHLHFLSLLQTFASELINLTKYKDFDI